MQTLIDTAHFLTMFMQLGNHRCTHYYYCDHRCIHFSGMHNPVPGDLLYLPAEFSSSPAPTHLSGINHVLMKILISWFMCG